MRNLGLDLLRLFAVLLVMGRHLQIPEEISSPFLSIWKTGGWVGVDVFFVLSGFLVSGLFFKEYQKKGSIDIKRFLIRRGFKIYPAFWCMLMMTVFVAALRFEQIFSRWLLGEILFLQNYLGGLWNHTWSLAVEEHFYIGLSILFLLLVKVAGKNPFRFIPSIAILLVCICLGLRILNMHTYEMYTYENFLYGTHIRMDSLFFGVLISYYWHFKSLQSRLEFIPSVIFIVLGLLLLAPAFIFTLEDHKWISVYGFILFYLGASCLIFAITRINKSNNIFLRFAGALGASSYSIYLWHMPVNFWGSHILKKSIGLDSFLIYSSCYFVGALSIGYFMSKIVEFPILRLRDKLAP